MARKIEINSILKLRKATIILRKAIIKNYQGRGKRLDTIIGRFIWSKAGRDKGCLFIIIGIVDDQHVMVADGSLRRVGNPKKKKLKHLNITNKAAEDIKRTITIKRKLLDTDLQKAIDDYKDDLHLDNS